MTTTTTATKNDVSWSTDYPFEAHVFDFDQTHTCEAETPPFTPHR